MSTALKAEREEFILRAFLAKGDVDRAVRGDASGGPGVMALGLRAKYESSGDDEAGREAAVEELKVLLSEPGSAESPSVQLTAAHVFLSHGMTKEALKCVHLGATIEHLAMTVQIYLRIDRPDMAREQLNLMRQADEDAVLTQLSGIYVDIGNGASTASDAVHALRSLSEQYGPSLMLHNCMACAHLASGNLAEAEMVLKEATDMEGGSSNADTLINTVVCYQHLGKSPAEIEPLLLKLRSDLASHPFVQGLKRVEAAFEREALKYKVESVV